MATRRAATCSTAASANDTLTGHGGADTFAFRTVPGTNNVDHITDFVASIAAVHDTIQMGESVFIALSADALTSDSFAT